MLRGVDGRPVFIDNYDRVRFCLLLQEAAERHKFRMHAFCLMTNHIHLLLEPLEGNLSSGMQRFAGRYAQHFNKRRKKRGYVFQGRFRSILIEGGLYMKRLMRYIHLNPLEAGLVSDPENYQWSSHNAYFGRGDFTWLETERVLSNFGSSRTTALINLANYMAAKTDASEDIEEILQASREGIYGSEEFKRSFVKIDRSEESYIENDFPLESLIDIVCERFGVTSRHLHREEKTRSVVDARAVLARTAQLLKGISLNDICKALNKCHGTLSRLATRVIKHGNLQEIAEKIVLEFS